MGIFEKLEEIREKPIAARKRLLFVWMAVSMTVVIILWIGILKFGGSENKTSNTGPGPLELLKRSLKLTN